MLNKSINCVTSTKSLGIIIDNKLKWNEHIIYVKNKISKAVAILYKIRKLLDKSTLLICTLSFSELLAPSTHPLFERLNILKFNNLVIRRISLFMYKYSIGEVPSPISLLFRTNITYHEHNTRRASCLHTPIGRSEAIHLPNL